MLSRYLLGIAPTPATCMTCFHQLLIDLQTVKACLLKLPGDNLATSRCAMSDTHPLANPQWYVISYTRSLNKSTGRLEALLKVIVTPVVGFVSFCIASIPDRWYPRIPRMDLF